MGSYYVYRTKRVTYEIVDFVHVQNCASEDEAIERAMKNDFDSYMQELPETKKEVDVKLISVYNVEPT